MTISECKDLISQRFIGKWSIHGVGYSRNTVTVYSDNPLTIEQQGFISSFIAPISVIFKVEELPVLR